MEVWDAYDSRFNKVEGETLIRGKPIPEGRYHLVCDVIVRHEDGSYLLMQRDHRKSFGGLWEASAGGSALQGEDAMTCALRELKEETGICDGVLTELGTVIHNRNHAIYVEFLCETSIPKENVVLQEGETIGYRWVRAGKIRHMSHRELSTSRMQMFIRELRYMG